MVNAHQLWATGSLIASWVGARTRSIWQPRKPQANYVRTAWSCVAYYSVQYIHILLPITSKTIITGTADDAKSHGYIIHPALSLADYFIRLVGTRWLLQVVILVCRELALVIVTIYGQITLLMFDTVVWRPSFRRYDAWFSNHTFLILRPMFLLGVYDMETYSTQWTQFFQVLLYWGVCRVVALNAHIFTGVVA